MVDLSNVRSGRKPHNPVAMAAAPAHQFDASEPVTALNRSLIDLVPEAWDNLTDPDCTYVSMANAARGVAHLNGSELVIEPGKVSAGYAANAGVANTPAAIQATDGLVMLDVQSYQAQHGFDIGPQKLVAKGGTIPLTKQAMAKATDRLGLPWCGLVLYERDMDTINPYSRLDVQAGRSDGAIVGRHAVPLWTYTGLADTDLVIWGTYGFWQRSTWTWWLERIEEAHGLVWRQLARTDGTFYDGLTPDGLLAATIAA